MMDRQLPKDMVLEGGFEAKLNMMSHQTGLVYLQGKLKDTNVSLLLDTGATNSFVSASCVRRLGLEVKTKKEPVKVTFAQGSGMTTQVVAGLSFEVSNTKFIENFTMCELSGLDFVLDNTFLDSYGVEIRRKPKFCVVMVGTDGKPKVLSYTRQLVLDGLGINLVSQGQLDGVVFCLLAQNLAIKENKLPKLHKSTPMCVTNVLEKFRDVITAELPKELPQKREVDHKIELLPGSIPPSKAPYRLNQQELVELKRQLTELMERGYIRPSKSPFGAPVLFVSKKNGKFRMCVDYRALNKITVKNNYPLSRADDLMDRLSGAKYFTRIDLKSGYYQIRVAEKDVEKMACRTRYGSYEFVVMPFGLCNAPATFTTMINSIFHNETHDFVIIYIDDILVFSKTLEDHAKHLEKVLGKLREHKLYANAEKSEFALQEIEFLGQICNREGIRAIAKKLKAIKEWKVPLTQKGVRSFLGLANYYRKFIKDFSMITGPLSDLLTKDNKKFIWNPKCQEAFDALKKALTSSGVLRYPDFEKEFEVHTDVSGFVIGGVLMQDGHPIAFESKKLTDSQLRWPTHEKELFAVVHCLKV